MKIITKCDGTVTEHDIDPGVRALVHNPDIKVEAPNAKLVSIKETTACMAEMSQKAWEFISTGPLFQALFEELTKDRRVTLPATIKALNEDYSEGVIHACGLIVMLVEARFAGTKEVFVRTPEDAMHPAWHARLMSLFMMIEKIPLGGDTQPKVQCS